MAYSDTDDNETEPNIFSEPSPMRTIGLKVEEEIFWISRETLSMYSPVFEKMFYGKFAEADQVVIPLPGKKADDIREFLMCLIPSPTQKEIDDDNIDCLLSLANEYQVDELIKRVSNYLEVKSKIDFSDNISFNADQKSQLLNILLIHSKYRMRELLMIYIPKCSSITSKTLQPLFAKLPSEVIACLMLYRFQLRSENTKHILIGYDGTYCTPQVVCGTHSPEHMSRRCSQCGKLFCQKCSTSTCISGITGFEKIEETMRDLLARMK